MSKHYPISITQRFTSKLGSQKLAFFSLQLRLTPASELYLHGKHSTFIKMLKLLLFCQLQPIAV